MSKRNSSNLEEKISKKGETSTEKNSKTEENITKKQFTSSNTSTTTNIIQQKHINLRKRQEQILMNIENINIQKHVQSLIDKFDPPNCTNCPKRRADRVCINKKCGPHRFMQIICGKCHFDEHQNCITKPEVDIDEYFIKLATFMNEQKYQDDKSKTVQRIDLDNLETVFDDIDSFRMMLKEIRPKIENEIEDYISPQEMHGQLQNSITKALSHCEYDNIQEQLMSVKKSVIFEKNQFHWNDASEKFKSFQKIFSDLDQIAKNTSKKISKSFIGGHQIDLNEIKCLLCLYSFGFYSFQQQQPKDSIQGKNGEIKLNSNNIQCQYFLDYKMDVEKKYKLRFRFESQPSQYIMVGVMPYSMASATYVYSVPNQYFCKRFYCTSPTEECSKILKGQDLSEIVQKGNQIELRVDFENNYVDFYDYPEMNNINANHESNKFVGTEFTIAFSFYQSHTVVIESFEELSSVDQLI